MKRGSRPGDFPRGAILGAGGLILFTLLAAGANRLGGAGPTEAAAPVAAEPVASVELRFVDRPDGAVAVYGVPDGRTVAVLAPGTNGFIRGVLRGLARERRQHEVGLEPPFRLTRWPDGGLSLEDSATGRRIELQAFGPTNLDAFARLMVARGGSEAS